MDPNGLRTAYIHGYIPRVSLSEGCNRGFEILEPANQINQGGPRLCWTVNHPLGDNYGMQSRQACTLYGIWRNCRDIPYSSWYDVQVKPSTATETAHPNESFVSARAELSVGIVPGTFYGNDSRNLM